MPERTAIMRFSNSEKVLTIESHRWIIENQGGYVWWGWWRKDTEPSALELLRKLQANVSSSFPIRIGLLNRKGADEFYAATCIEVRHAEDGGRISSPEPDKTPEYYRNERFPAWFKVQKFEHMKLADFRREFGAMPSIDPTLYEVLRGIDGDPTKVQVFPEETWSMAPVETNGEAILHLSDLHFGEFHGFPLASPAPGHEYKGRPLWEVIATRINVNLGLRIGMVVISGDLITKGEGKSYVDARDFIERLLNELKLETHHCVVVPGNHDMWTEDEQRLTRRYAHERPYRDFIDGLFAEKFSSLERVRRFRTPSGRDLIFVELNSARLRNDALKEYGFVAKHRYEELLKYVCRTLVLEREKEPSKSSPMLFMVLHHHLVPVNAVDIPDEKRPLSLCLDAGELVTEFQRYGVHFALHGHQHAPFIGRVTPYPILAANGTISERPLYIIGCGSSGGKREILPRDLIQNTYGIYIPNGDHLKVSIEKYTDKNSPEVHRELRLKIVPWVAPSELTLPC